MRVPLPLIDPGSADAAWVPEEVSLRRYDVPGPRCTPYPTCGAPCCRGCNEVITRHHDKVSAYLEVLRQAQSLTQTQLHLSGGPGTRALLARALSVGS